MNKRQGNTSDFVSDLPQRKGMDAGFSPLAGEEPEDLGELDIHIDAEGMWFWDGDPVTRQDLICMLAFMLSRDEKGAYWLRTPTEFGRIRVDDVPFIAVEAFAIREGRDQVITLRTNVDEMITVDAEHPLRIHINPKTGEPRPYVGVGAGLEARLSRPVYYELVERGTEWTIDGHTVYGLWSAGVFFVLGQLEPDS